MRVRHSLAGCLLVACAMLASPLRTAAQTAGAQPTQYKDALRLLDHWLDAQAAFDKVPALSAGVVIGQELVWSRGYGFVDERRTVPADAQTIYSICSISKLFTSVAAMQLWEEEKLSLDDDIGKVLPSFRMERTDPDARISVRGLLTHSAGLPRETLAASWPPATWAAPTREEILAELSRQHTFMRPSDHGQYSNLALVLVGEVVASVSGKPYEQYVTERILALLQMPDTRPYLPKEQLGRRMPVGYGAVKRDGTRDRLPLFEPKGLVAAAGYSSTVADLARFAAWQFRLNRNGGTEVLRVSTLREMQRVQWTEPDGKGTWGLGFSVAREGPNTIASHAGRCPGYESAIALALKDEVALISLANAQNGGPYTRTMRQIVLKGLRLPVTAGGAGLPDLESFAGRYSALPWRAERIIVPWGKDLALVSLPDADPATNMLLLRHVSGDLFREVREDGTLGIEFRFERDAEQRVTGYREWSYAYKKLGNLR